MLRLSILDMAHSLNMDKILYFTLPGALDTNKNVANASKLTIAESIHQTR